MASASDLVKQKVVTQKRCRNSNGREKIDKFAILTSVNFCGDYWNV